MTRAPLLAMLFAIGGPAVAGKVYRCPYGSYQDKPCGQGERVVANNNRQAAGDEMEVLMDQRRMLDERFRELCL